MAEAVEEILKKETECALIGGDGEARERLEELSSEFEFKVFSYKDLDSFMSKQRNSRVVVFTVSFTKNVKELVNKMTEVAQGVSFHCPQANIVAIVDRKLEPGEILFLEKSGAHFILPRADLSQTSRLDFFINQRMKAEFFPIKMTDLVMDEKVPFDLFHLMPANQKFLRIVSRGGVLDQRRWKKMDSFGEFYVHRSQYSDFFEFSKNVAAKQKRNRDGLQRKQFTKFSLEFNERALKLTDMHAPISFKEGQQLLDDCSQMVEELVEQFADVQLDEIAKMINQSKVGEFGSVERGPAVAIYCHYLAKELGIENQKDLVLSALFSYLGVLLVAPRVGQKFRMGESLSREERAVYDRFPLNSLDVLLNRRFSLNEQVKHLLSTAFERADGSGFPRHLAAHSLSFESQIVGFSIYYDEKTSIKMGESRFIESGALQCILEEEFSSLKKFTATFLGEMRRKFLAK